MRNPEIETLMKSTTIGLSAFVINIYPAGKVIVYHWHRFPVARTVTVDHRFATSYIQSAARRHTFRLLITSPSGGMPSMLHVTNMDEILSPERTSVSVSRSPMSPRDRV